MKKIIYSLIAAIMCTASSLAFAANPQPANAAAASITPTKIAVLDMRQVMEKSVQIAKIRESLQKEFKPKSDKLIAARNELKNDADRLRRDNAIMNNNDRKQLEQKIITEEQDLQRLQTTLQQEVTAAQNKALQGFLEVVKGIVEKVAKNENLTLVITRDTVAYVQADLDITNKVVQQLPHK